MLSTVTNGALKGDSHCPWSVKTRLPSAPCIHAGDTLVEEDWRGTAVSEGAFSRVPGPCNFRSFCLGFVNVLHELRGLLRRNSWVCCFLKKETRLLFQWKGQTPQRKEGLHARVCMCVDYWGASAPTWSHKALATPSPYLALQTAEPAWAPAHDQWEQTLRSPWPRWPCDHAPGGACCTAPAEGLTLRAHRPGPQMGSSGRRCARLRVATWPCPSSSYPRH